jgi:hypothetical protein
MINFLNGWKTYLAALALAGFASSEYFFGLPKLIDQTTWVNMLIAAAGLAGLRSSVAVGFQKILASLGINLPANATVEEVKFKAMAVAKRNVPALLVALFLLPAVGLMGCAGTTGGNIFGDSTGTTIGKGEVVILGGQQFYLTNCVGAVIQPYCAQYKAQVKDVDHKVATVVNDLVHTYEAGGDTTVLVTQLGVDVLDIDTLFINMGKKDARKKLDILMIVQLAQVAIQVGSQVYTMIQNMGTPTNQQLDDWNAQIQANDAAIQAS